MVCLKNTNYITYVRLFLSLFTIGAWFVFLRLDVYNLQIVRWILNGQNNRWMHRSNSYNNLEMHNNIVLRSAYTIFVSE